MKTDWTSPEDVKNQVQRLWDRGRILANRFEIEPIFPWRSPFRAPESAILAEKFSAVRDWINTLEKGSRLSRGFGYDIVWREVNHRQLGRNTIPHAIEVATEIDALRMIGKIKEADTFSQVTESTLETFPVLKNWLARNPLTALSHADDWGRILAVLSWFNTHHKSGLYLRQIDVADVDTKFMEGRRGLLAQLLTLVLPSEAVDTTTSGTKGFEQRFGLRSEPLLVRFRLLDPSQSLAGLTDLSVPAGQLASLSQPARRVFITENKVNGLAFPDTPEAMVIFGLGNGFDRLHEITWLQDKEIYYWGDLDTHGFHILNRLRTSFPHARSFLMGRDVLLAHRSLWGREEQKFIGNLERLTDSERSVYEGLRDDHFGKNIRLEQERISFAAVKYHVQGEIS